MVLLAITSLVILLYFTFTEYNSIRAFKASDLLIAGTEDIIAENDEDRNNLHQFFKRLYLEKAKTASYLIDSKPELETDLHSLHDLADVMGVDQIHIFNPEGVIYSGTNPEYYGLSMDDGEQIRFFKPMLNNKFLSLSQDVTPNTAEGRIMLYSMCWNEDGTRLVQVGAYGERFPRIMNRNQIEMFLDLIPENPASDIILTDTDSDQVIASTNTDYIGKELSDIGIDMGKRSCKERIRFNTGFSNNPIYCSAKEHKDYRILIAQYKNVADENIPITLFTFTEYLVLVFIAMTYVVDFYYDKFMQEKACAMRDKLTGLYNRRAYEAALNTLEDHALDPNLVFVAMDVNGLKGINDTLGHQAGDVLLKGAASCMLQCFHSLGKVYRFGGDEFFAIIHGQGLELTMLKERLDGFCRQWSVENRITLSISLGYAKSSDIPQASIHRLESLDDQKMYADKASYYSKEKHDRRGGSDESK